MSVPRATLTGTAKLRWGRGTSRPPLLPSSRPGPPHPGLARVPFLPGGTQASASSSWGHLPLPWVAGVEAGWCEQWRGGPGWGPAGPTGGSVCVVGHVEGLPGGPRVVPAALILAQRRQPVHLWGEKALGRGTQPSCPPEPHRRGPRCPPSPPKCPPPQRHRHPTPTRRNTALGVPILLHRGSPQSPPSPTGTCPPHHL